jgi:Zn-dependent M28 family amino/carboxypeptidase
MPSGRIRQCLILVSIVALRFASGSQLASQRIEFNKVAPAILEERLRQVVDKNPEREQVLHKLFENAGCLEDHLVEQPVRGSRTPNVICTLKGTADVSVVVGAHFDKVANGHGVVDNWSGASLLPSLFQGLSANPRRLTFIFVGFTDEEKGLVGSRFYVKHLTPDEKSSIRAMVNLDSLGLSDTKVWVNRAGKALVLAAGRVANSMNLPLAPVNVDKVGDSDSRPFVDAKIPSIDFHSVTQITFPILHSPGDTISAVRLPEYENSYSFVIAYLAYLDATLAAGSPAPSP